MATVTLRLGQEQLKPFVSAITCVSKAGKEISLECDAETITLRALNDAHSASAEITFDSGFLDGYTPPSLAGDGRPTALVKCTTMASTWQSVFRSLKNVLSMEIELEVDDGDNGGGHDAVDASVIVFRLCCDKRITKTHRIKTTDTQTLRPIFDKASSPSRIKMRPFHLTTLLQHIHGTDEVSMTCGKDQVRFESYYTNPLDVKKHVHTETTVDTAEFIAYLFEPGEDPLNEAVVQLIFCLKEIRVPADAIEEAVIVLRCSLTATRAASPSSFCTLATAAVRSCSRPSRWRLRRTVLKSSCRRSRHFTPGRPKTPARRKKPSTSTLPGQKSRSGRRPKKHKISNSTCVGEWATSIGDATFAVKIPRFAMPSAALLLEEAFGKHMLTGAAEWREVPDVVRSSLYVLQKVLLHLDARLSRCETDKPSSSALLATLQKSLRGVEADCQGLVTSTVTAATAPLEASVARLKKAVAHRLQTQQEATQALTTQIQELQALAREADDAYKHKLNELGRRAATHAGSLAHYDLLEKLEMRCKTLERQFALHASQARPVEPRTSDVQATPTNDTPLDEPVADLALEAANDDQACDVVLAPPVRLLTLREKREASRLRFEEAARRQKARWATQRDETSRRLVI